MDAVTLSIVASALLMVVVLVKLATASRSINTNTSQDRSGAEPLTLADSIRQKVIEIEKKKVEQKKEPPKD